MAWGGGEIRVAIPPPPQTAVSTMGENYKEYHNGETSDGKLRIIQSFNTL